MLINCILLVGGQLLWKIGLKEVEFNSLKDIVLAFFNKYIFAGIVIYVAATGYWLSILKRYDLTKVYPLQSISYILVILSGFLILKEPVSKYSIIGTVIICIGVFIITKK